MKLIHLLTLGLLLLPSLHRADARDCKPGTCPGPHGQCYPCETLPVPTTPTGIRIDAPWKSQLIDFARKQVVHPSWGFAHSERNYQVTLELARREGLALDLDALLAASFLHDLGGLAAFARPGVDHAVRSVELIEPLLREWGFPMAKWPQVSELVLGHVYYGPVPSSRPAQLFRDADILDFLGAMGVARILAATAELPAPETLAGPVGTLDKFARELPAKLTCDAARTLGRERVIEMNEFLLRLGHSAFEGKAL